MSTIIHIVRWVKESQTAAGKNPLFVMDMTDVDDKLLAAAAANAAAAKGNNSEQDPYIPRSPCLWRDTMNKNFGSIWTR